MVPTFSESDKWNVMMENRSAWQGEPDKQR